ncbi:uncharacterized protein LOC105200992 [Solenopsis invicta]|uniref:uncharacterized protein LOC105200992 n=1 Tax=Solenopsis invicta TaxID=13686 RepID=UPI000E340082|nr:uncharacterized protein LOC105200992 [Solenopsis invicta]
MSEVIRNLEKYGTEQVTKKDRQKFTKKVFSSDDENYDAGPAVKKNKAKKIAQSNAVAWRSETWEKFKEAKKASLKGYEENEIPAESLLNENVDEIRESVRNTHCDRVFMSEIINGYEKVLTSLQEGFATIRQDLKCLKSDIKEIKEVQIIQRSNKSNNLMDDSTEISY